MARERKSMAPGERTVLYLSRVLVWVAVIFALIPIYFVFRASIASGNSFFQANPFNFSRVTFANYALLFQPNPGFSSFPTWLLNSLAIGLGVAVVQLFFTATSAYAFSRLRFWGRKYGLMTLLILQMFPALMTLTAIYTGLSYVHGMDNLIWYGAILAGGSAFNIWLMKGYFDALPHELDEAAIMDGANHFTIFWRIILPLSSPMLVVIFLFIMIGTFSEYPLASLTLSSPGNYTLGLGLQYLLNPTSLSHNFPEFSAAALLSAVPLTILYMVFQRWIASGLVAGAVKG